MSEANATCDCGHTEIEINGPPLFRLFCHCTLCQKFNKAPYSDVVIYKAADITEPPMNKVEYSVLKPPPNVQRGTCVECSKPVIEKFIAPIFPSLIIVPAVVHNDTESLPNPCAHIFYDKRVNDSTDALPKYSGFIRSQLAFGKYLFTGKKT